VYLALDLAILTNWQLRRSEMSCAHSSIATASRRAGAPTTFLRQFFHRVNLDAAFSRESLPGGILFFKLAPPSLFGHSCAAKHAH
jgi:hypothetical protein